jgi:hypothetical protein
VRWVVDVAAIRFAECERVIGLDAGRRRWDDPVHPTRSKRPSFSGRMSVASTGRPTIAQAYSISISMRSATDARRRQGCPCAASARFRTDSTGVVRQPGRCGDSRACALVEARHAANPVAACRSKRSPGTVRPTIPRIFNAFRVAGAQKRTRTSTALRPPAPEAGASTNSAIWARGRRRPLGDASAPCQHASNTARAPHVQTPTTQGTSRSCATSW